MPLYTVMGLPFKRTINQLTESEFLKLLDAEQTKELGRWLDLAEPGDEFQAGWFGEEWPCSLTVKRVA
jgi:hypothetical protein